MDHPVKAAADNLKKVRESRGLSFDQLSELTGVSKSMLRQIETGKSSPTISTIWKIANGLRISFTALLRKPALKAEVKSFTSGNCLTAEGEKYRLFPLIPFDPQQAFETYYFELDPGTAFPGEPHEGNIQEYLFVTKGTLQLSINGQTFVINENEYIQFEANFPHEYKCLSKHTVSVIMQVSYLP
jgi:transcriptional regulator with XRE-family HTH domain